MAMHVKKGDIVKIICGDDKGKQGADPAGFAQE